jgi:hypothetical protein
VHEAAAAQDASGDVPLRMDDRFASEKALLESSGTRTIVRRSNSATRPICGKVIRGAAYARSKSSRGLN